MCRPTLEADVSSTPDGKFNFAYENELVEDAIHNVLEDDIATVQENVTLRFIMQRRRHMGEKG